MDTAMLLEIFGYIGSTLVVVSMLMSSVIKLRIINTIGSVVSGIYAVICGAYPLALMNACLIIINVYNLFKLLKTEQEYDLIESKMDDSMLDYFLERNKEDIRNFFPGFTGADNCNKAFVVYCNGNPAGVLLGNVDGECVDVVIDYSIPTYRDCSVGTYLYSKLPQANVKMLRFAQEESEVHVSYMRKMGFQKENNSYVKPLS